jgi:gliding motility-associated-like protein
MFFMKFLFQFLILVSFTLCTAAQIYAPAAGDSFPAAYNPPGGTDEVFVFNRPAYQEELQAAIVAVSVDGQTGWAFQWSVYHPETGSYQAIPGTTSSWFSEVDTITVSSGYQVIMTKGAISHVYRIWILINDLDVFITNKDDQEKLLFGYYNCSSLDLRADTTRIPLNYYNPESNTRISLFVNYTIRWTTDNPEAVNPASKLVTRVNSPPAEDTWYILTLSDPYGLTRSDSVLYESIQSKAVLAAPEYINLSDEEEYPGKNYGTYYQDAIYSAPGKYRFDVSGSRNLASYEIDFGDGEIFVDDGDSLKVVHEYQRPGIYKVVLTTKSAAPYECLDSASAEAELAISLFTLPNVFTPNGDGDNDMLMLESSNDVFRSEDISVISIEIAIFDRAGIKVHEYSGTIRDWSGWDGNVRQSNREAPEGVYFYVVSALHFFDEGSNNITSRPYKGFFHLYRD